MDRAFFEQLAMPLFDQLYNHACWLTGDRTDAEDLVQETYAKALKGFAAFAEGTNLRAWMFRILRNAFLTSRSGLAAQKTGYLEDEERKCRGSDGARRDSRADPAAQPERTGALCCAGIASRELPARSSCSAMWRRCRIARSRRCWMCRWER